MRKDLPTLRMATSLLQCRTLSPKRVLICQAMHLGSTLLATHAPAARYVCSPRKLALIQRFWQHLSALVQRGAEAVGAVVTDNGLLTTPQLHHIVRMTNFAEAGKLQSHI